MSANQVRTATVFVLGMILLVGALTWHPRLGATNPPVQEKSPSPQDKKDAVDEKTIATLIKQLGDDSFDIREAADKKLTAIGEPAMDLLKKAAMESTDPEVRQHRRSHHARHWRSPVRAGAAITRAQDRANAQGQPSGGHAGWPPSYFDWY